MRWGVDDCLEPSVEYLALELEVHYINALGTGAVLRARNCPSPTTSPFLSNTRRMGLQLRRRLNSPRAWLW